MRTTGSSTFELQIQGARTGVPSKDDPLRYVTGSNARRSLNGQLGGHDRSPPYQQISPYLASLPQSSHDLSGGRRSASAGAGLASGSAGTSGLGSAPGRGLAAGASAAVQEAHQRLERLLSPQHQAAAQGLLKRPISAPLTPGGHTGVSASAVGLAYTGGKSSYSGPGTGGVLSGSGVARPRPASANNLSSSSNSSIAIKGGHGGGPGGMGTGVGSSSSGAVTASISVSPGTAALLSTAPAILATLGSSGNRVMGRSLSASESSSLLAVMGVVGMGGRSTADAGRSSAAAGGSSTGGKARPQSPATARGSSRGTAGATSTSSGRPLSASAEPSSRGSSALDGSASAPSLPYGSMPTGTAAATLAASSAPSSSSRKHAHTSASSSSSSNAAAAPLAASISDKILGGSGGSRTGAAGTSGTSGTSGRTSLEAGTATGASARSPKSPSGPDGNTLSPKASSGQVHHSSSHKVSVSQHHRPKKASRNSSDSTGTGTTGAGIGSGGGGLLASYDAATGSQTGPQSVAAAGPQEAERSSSSQGGSRESGQVQRSRGSKSSSAAAGPRSPSSASSPTAPAKSLGGSSKPSAFGSLGNSGGTGVRPASAGRGRPKTSEGGSSRRSAAAQAADTTAAVSESSAAASFGPGAEGAASAITTTRPSSAGGRTSSAGGTTTQNGTTPAAGAGMGTGGQVISAASSSSSSSYPYGSVVRPSSAERRQRNASRSAAGSGTDGNAAGAANASAGLREASARQPSSSSPMSLNTGGSGAATANGSTSGGAHQGHGRTKPPNIDLSVLAGVDDGSLQSRSDRPAGTAGRGDDAGADYGGLTRSSVRSSRSSGGRRTTGYEPRGLAATDEVADGTLSTPSSSAPSGRSASKSGYTPSARAQECSSPPPLVLLPTRSPLQSPRAMIGIPRRMRGGGSGSGFGQLARSRWPRNPPLQYQGTAAAADGGGGGGKDNVKDSISGAGTLVPAPSMPPSAVVMHDLTVACHGLLTDVLGLGGSGFVEVLRERYVEVYRAGRKSGGCSG